MIRDYAAAAREFEATLASDPRSKPVRKKLIICYAQLLRVNEALALFSTLIVEDIEFIINTSPDADDCPCPDLIFEEENSVRQMSHPKTNLPILGMLWLYCNAEKSLEYFEQATAADSGNTALQSIVKKLRIHLRHKESGIVLHGN